MFDEGFSRTDANARHTSLNSLAVGESGIVVALDCPSPELRNKLLVMGIVAGTIVKLDRIAPLGDPITVQILGFSLSLRRNEAECVRVIPRQ